MSDQNKQQELIQQLKNFSVKHPGKVTRRAYIADGGNYEFEKAFGSFSEFVKAAGLAGDSDVPDTVSSESAPQQDITEDKWVITLPKTTINNYDQLKAEFKINESIWAVKRFNATYDERNEMYRVVAFLAKKKDAVAARREIDALRELAKTEILRFPEEVKRSREKSGKMLEVNVPDIHMGKLAWPEETGFGPYDIKIASATYVRAIRALIERTKGTQYDSVLYVIGNDMLNADDLEGRTTGGTQVTNDGRYHKVFSVARNTIIWAIEELRKVAPVKVISVLGNHDRLSAWTLTDSVQSWFHTYSDVTFDNSPRQRKYHEFGNVMLGFTHGDKGDREDYALLLATEQPEMFGRTKFREMHTGHLHKTKLDEKHGVRVRILPALTQADDWHSENSYIGNLRNAEAYTWDSREGLIAITIYNDDSQEPLVTKQEFV